MSGDDIAQLIFFLVVLLISGIASVLKKINEWINQKRMQVDRHPEPARQREETYRPRRVAQPTPPEVRAERPAGPPALSPGEEILRQLEAMLPPEVAEARRKAREAAASQRQATTAPSAPPKPTPPAERPVAPPARERPPLKSELKPPRPTPAPAP